MINRLRKDDYRRLNRERTCVISRFYESLHVLVYHTNLMLQEHYYENAGRLFTHRDDDAVFQQSLW